MSFPRRVPAPAKLHSSQLRAPEVSRRPQPTDASEGVGTFRQTRLGFEEFSRSLGARRRDRTWQSGLPDFAMRVSRDLRTGASIDQALIDAITNTNAPAYVLEVASGLRAGQPIGKAIERWVEVALSESERLLVTALAIGLRAGAQLAPVLDGLAVALRDELALDARRRVLLVQAQVSALVLVAMPVGFSALSSALRGGFAFSGVVGVALLVVGLTLDGIGVIWMRRLLRGLR